MRPSKLSYKIWDSGWTHHDVDRVRPLWIIRDLLEPEVIMLDRETE